MANHHLSHNTASAGQSIDHQYVINKYSFLLPTPATPPIEPTITSQTTQPLSTPPLIPFSLIHGTPMPTASRNGGYNQFIGPFYCRWESCSMADHQFHTGKDIWRHIEESHLHVRPRKSDGYQCQWMGCSEIRPSLFRLKSHMRKHLDWRPFDCNHCDERFKHRGDQKKHIARKHLSNNKTRVSSSIRNHRVSSSSRTDGHSHSPSQRNYTYIPVTYPPTSQPTPQLDSQSDSQSLIPQPVPALPTLPLTMEDSNQSLGYYVSNQASPGAAVYPVYTPMIPMSFPQAIVSGSLSPLLDIQNAASNQQLMAATAGMTNTDLSSIVVSQDTPHEPNADVCAPSTALKNGNSWLHGNTYAQSISQADSVKEEDREKGDFDMEMTPDASLSDMTDLSPHLVEGVPSLTQCMTPPTMPTDYCSDLPTSLMSLPSPVLFDGLDCYPYV